MIAIIKILFENKKIRDLIKQKWSACVHRWVTRSVARHIFFATACQLLFLDRSSMAFVLLRFFVCCYNSIPLSFVLCKGQNPDSSFSTSIRLCSFNFVRGGWFCFLFKTFAVFFCEQLRQVIEPSGFRFEPDDDSIKNTDSATNPRRREKSAIRLLCLFRCEKCRPKKYLPAVSRRKER